RCCASAPRPPAVRSRKCAPRRLPRAASPAWPSPRTSPRSPCSCAPSARATSRAPRPRSTAARRRGFTSCGRSPLEQPATRRAEQQRLPAGALEHLSPFVLYSRHGHEPVGEIVGMAALHFGDVVHHPGDAIRSLRLGAAALVERGMIG